MQKKCQIKLLDTGKNLIWKIYHMGLTAENKNELEI